MSTCDNSDDDIPEPVHQPEALGDTGGLQTTDNSDPSSGTLPAAPRGGAASTGSAAFFFKCKTLEGHILKYVVEVLQNNFKVIYFDVDSTGMNVRNIDDNQNVMLDVTLDGSRFVSFQCKSKITIGVHIDHMFKIIKNIKKQDSVTLVILEDDPGMLRIDIERDSVCFCTSKLPLQTVQLRNIDLPPPTQYVHVINLSSREFFKIIKEVSTIADKVQVTTTSNCIDILSDNSGMFSKTFSIGTGAGAVGSVDDDNTTEPVSSTFYVQEFQKFAKIAMMSSMFTIKTGTTVPLCFEANIGQIGTLKAYIKHVDLSTVM
jgi:proliferating cell nuclear antigen PCNA